MGSPREDLLGTVLADRYELTQIIGEGGMGTVFRGHQLGVGRDVAIKILNPVAADDYEYVASLFFREARAICQLSHPNTIRLFDFGRTSENELYITMELVKGNSLSNLIRSGELSLFDAVHIGQALAEALMEAHDQGIIHRDIKPDNVLVEEKVWDKRFCKILDFGIARVIGQSSEANSPTLRFGTPLYMSPEQILGKSSDARTDIYMLGALLFECLTGHPPFIAKTAVDVCLMHLESPVPPLVRWDSPWQYPPRLVSLVTAMMAKEPEERPSTASKVAEELRIIAGEEHADERTSVISTQAISEEKTDGEPPQLKHSSLPQLRMSQSIELTDDFEKKLGDWKELGIRKPALKKDLSMTPQARDPRDLITRISPMQQGQPTNHDPFEKLDKATLNENAQGKSDSIKGSSESLWSSLLGKLNRGDAEGDTRESDLPTRGEEDGPPKWFLPLLSTLVIIWLVLMYVYFSNPGR